MKELICIICPRGCHLQIDDNLEVNGNFCVRGKEYAISEVSDPKRTLTSTVRVTNSMLSLCSVKTNTPIRKNDIPKVMEAINSLRIECPIKMGQVLAKDIAGSGSDLVATMEIFR